MLHLKFQDHRISGSGEEDILSFFLLYMGMAAILVSHVTKMIFTKFMFPFPKKAPHKILLRLSKWFKRKDFFENNVCIYLFIYTIF